MPPVDGGTALSAPFPATRGGRLTLVVTTEFDGSSLFATRELTIVGRNPPRELIRQALRNDVLRRIVVQESGGRQFNAEAFGGKSECPCYGKSGDTGLMQISGADVADDHLWNWHANVAKALEVFGNAQGFARGYPRKVAEDPKFKQLANQFNEAREKAGKARLEVKVPPFRTSGFDVDVGSLGQFELDTIRGYNGFLSKSDALGGFLHEFRIKLAPDGGLLVEHIDEQAKTAEAVWEPVPENERPTKPGDPNYVTNVLKQEPL